MRVPDPTSWLIALAAVALGGCATSSLDLAPPAADRPWHPETNAAGDIVPGPALTDNSAAPKDYSLPHSTTLSTVPPAAPLDATHPYTLPELIDLAESANPMTRIAWNDARDAALARGIAKSTYLPQLSATAMAGYVASRTTTPSLLGDVYTNTHGSGSIAALSMEWLLFDFGGRHAAVDVATQTSVAANVAFTAAHQQVIYEVSVAYYAYQAARARVHSTELALSNADAIQAAAQSRLKRGVGTVIEVAQATQNRAQANLADVQAKGAQSDTYLSLLSAMGISPLSTLKVDELPPRTLSPALDAPVEQIVKDTIASRPDIQGAYALAQAGEAKVRAARASFMPKVFVAASAGYGSGSAGFTTTLPIIGQLPTANLSNSRYGGNVFVGVTIPLYDGGMRAAVLEQARNDQDSALTKLDRTQEEAVRQIVTAQNTLRTSLASQSAAKALMDAAQTTYDASFDAYNHGVGSITDALRAQNGLLTAQNAYTDSYSAALSAAATLALATGKIGSGSAASGAYD